MCNAIYKGCCRSHDYGSNCLNEDSGSDTKELNLLSERSIISVCIKYNQSSFKIFVDFGRWHCAIKHFLRCRKFHARLL